MSIKTTVAMEAVATEPLAQENLVQAAGLRKTYRSGGKQTVALQGVSFSVKVK
ncbi:MAG: hypothetical protein QW304_03620 [Thermoproteota archaeon]